MKIKYRYSKVLIFLLCFLIVMSSIITYQLFNPIPKNNLVNLSLFEERWIQENKNKMIDIAILNNIPIFSSGGEGLIFSLLDAIKIDSDLDFNKISYNINGPQPNNQFIFKIIDNNQLLSANDLLLLEDYYVVLSKEKEKINDLKLLDDTNIGLLRGDLNKITNYLNQTKKISYVPVDNIDELNILFEDNLIDYLIIPRQLYFPFIITNEYQVVYTFNNLSIKYVLTYHLDNDDKLNSIIKKYFQGWMANDYLNDYNEAMFKLYADLKNISDEQKDAFKSKRYIYGYLENKPYDALIDNKLAGINSQFIDPFASFSNIELTHKKYNSIETLYKDFNKGEIDIIFDYYNFNVTDNYLATNEVIANRYVVLSSIKNNLILDGLTSLDGKTIATIKNLKLTKFLDRNTEVSWKLVDRFQQLLNYDLILLDYNTYLYYKHTKLSNYNLIFEDDASPNYRYLISNKDNNRLFYLFYQYYLTSINEQQYQYLAINNLLLTEDELNLSSLWLYIILIPSFGVMFYFLLFKIKQLKKAKEYTKVKYIDHLTSLKNRCYLNHHLHQWEENTVYPQAIMIINLNNIKEINNNYGHDEGDRLIKMVANILINHQLSKTDVIRIDGDEFLIYMIGYEKVAIEEYLKKLNNLFSDLPYDYGASLGYSMITDDIKTIDDATNEAILNMLKDKEAKKSNKDS